MFKQILAFWKNSGGCLKRAQYRLPPQPQLVSSLPCYPISIQVSWVYLSVMSRMRILQISESLICSMLCGYVDIVARGLKRLQQLR